MAKVNLTDRTVSAAKAAPGERLEIWDALTPGLALRVTDRGVKSWILRYRTLDGRQPRFKIGDATRLSLRSARLEAGRLKDLIDKGQDPQGEKRQAREVARSVTVRTFDDLLDAYWTACEAGTWKPKKKKKRASTLDYEKRLAERHISPAFKALALDTIKRGTVEALLLERLKAGIGAQTIRADWVNLFRKCQMQAPGAWRGNNVLPIYIATADAECLVNGRDAGVHPEWWAEETVNQIEWSVRPAVEAEAKRRWRLTNLDAPSEKGLAAATDVEVEPVRALGRISSEYTGVMRGPPAACQPR